MPMARVQTGLEQCLDTPPRWARNARWGLLCNPASVDAEFRHARELFVSRFPGRLAALFSPQHGFFAEKQDNMIESADEIDPLTGVPVYSLYGETRIPTQEMLDTIDILLVDLQDAGTRVYTFIYTLSYCMEAVRRLGKKIVVLDRPNPIGGETTEGNCLRPQFSSFVGRFPIPMRHGLTIGELALLFNDFYGIGCELEVIRMKGWERSMYFAETGLPWIPPSPNLPTPVSALLYPGQVLWEGTNVSEGRGTAQPFEIFGAPFIDIGKIASDLGGYRVPGAVLRPIRFQPTSNKWVGNDCSGFQIHVTDRNAFRPFLTGLTLLGSICRQHPDELRWKPPPYEYEFEKLPIDLILGDDRIRLRIENGDPITAIASSWETELNRFIDRSRAFHLYPPDEKKEA
jgi:uncharacterized protein YbbC (DUF1343 family)